MWERAATQRDRQSVRKARRTVPAVDKFVNQLAQGPAIGLSGYQPKSFIAYRRRQRDAAPIWREPWPPSRIYHSIFIA